MGRPAYGCRMAQEDTLLREALAVMERRLKETDAERARLAERQVQLNDRRRLLVDGIAGTKALLGVEAETAEAPGEPVDEAGAATVDEPLPAPPPRPSGRTAREAIAAMLASENRAFKVSEIIERIGEFGPAAAKDTVRSLIVKMSKDKQIVPVERGYYRLPDRAGEDGARSDPTRGQADVQWDAGLLGSALAQPEIEGVHP